MPSITADDVIWAYRAFLRRDPESTDVITRWVDGGGTLRDLVDLLLQSEEFAAVYSPANRMSALHQVTDIDVHVADADLRAMIDHMKTVWQRYGKEDPYFSVMTNPDYHSSRLADAKIEEFYATGRTTADQLERTARQHGIVIPKASVICDLGCGVGRVGEHFLRRYDNYIGVDISPTHIELAIRRFKHLAAAGVGLGQYQMLHLEQFIDDSSVEFDIFYSFIVLQHNPPPIIYYILSRCLPRVRVGGLAAFQVPNYIRKYRFSAADYRRGEGRLDTMEAHPLPQPYVFDLLHRHGYEVLKALPDDHIGPTGLSMSYFAQRVRA